MQEWFEENQRPKNESDGGTKDEVRDNNELRAETEEHRKRAEKIQQRLMDLDSDNVVSDDMEIPINIKRADLEEDLATGKSQFQWAVDKNEKRTVWVYLWTSTVFKEDTWTHFIAKLPGVRLKWMDPSKVK